MQNNIKIMQHLKSLEKCYLVMKSYEDVKVMQKNATLKKALKKCIFEISLYNKVALKSHSGKTVCRNRLDFH